MTTDLGAEHSASSSHMKGTSDRSMTRSRDLSSIQKDTRLDTVESSACPMKRSPMTKQLKWTYAFFTLNYFVLGLGAAYELISSIYLTDDDHGLTEDTISVGLGIARIPILSRILIGVLGDKRNLFNLGHRKPYIIIGIVFTSITYLALGILESNSAGLVERGNFSTVYFVLYFFVQLATTIQDAAGDGFLTESVPNDRAGSVQGWINCGRGFGSVLGFVVFSFTGPDLGWQVVHFFIAACVLAHLPFAFFLTEVPEDEREQFQWRAFLTFKSPKIQVACVFVFLLNIPSAMALFYLPLWIEDGLEFSEDLSGIILAISAVFVAIGAPLAGYFLDRYRGHLQWVFTAGIVFGALATAGFILADLNRNVIYLCAVLGGVFVGAMLALVFSLTMLLADDSIAGSFFAILDCIWTLGEIVALAFAGALLRSVGFLWSWAISCLLLLILIPIVFLMFRLPDAPSVAQSSKDYEVHDVGFESFDDGKPIKAKNSDDTSSTSSNDIEKSLHAHRDEVASTELSSHSAKRKGENAKNRDEDASRQDAPPPSYFSSADEVDSAPEIEMQEKSPEEVAAEV